MDLINRTDSQMLTPTLHVVPKNSPPLTLPLSKINELPIPVYGATSPQPDLRSNSVDRSASSKSNETQNEDDSSKSSNHTNSSHSHTTPFVPSGGLTRRFLDSLPASWPISTACLLQFVMEGDNRADAHLLATVVSKVLGLEADVQKGGWKQPASWEVGLFGSDHDQTLYG
jgi:proteasome assembly chaperone 2